MKKSNICHMLLFVRRGNLKTYVSAYLLKKPFGQPRQVDHLRSGVPDQPEQYDETPSLLKM